MENIELNSIHKDYLDESDSEEYHEITQEVVEEDIVPFKAFVTTISEHDFFVQHDTEKIKKVASKKKKTKNKEKPKKLMDIINSELLAKPLLIKNNINFLNNRKGQDSYLYKHSNLSRILEYSRSRNIENGMIRRKAVKISPIFPRILESSLSKNTIVYTQYMEPSLFSDIITEYRESETKQNPRFLDIILNNIKFKHHHEFSLEKLLSIKLMDVYKEYELIKNSLNDFSKNVEVNKRTRNSLKEKLIEISPNSKKDIRFDASVLKYTKIMLEFKEKYYKALQKEKEIIHTLLSLWTDIEIVREKSGTAKTGCRLEVKHNDMDHGESQNEWSQIHETEYSDLIAQIEYDYVQKYLEYKKSKRNRNSSNINENNIIAKPRFNINYEDLKVRVEKIVDDVLARNRTEIFLRNDENILSRPERMRKSVCLSNYYHFKIFVDDVFVCESEQYTNDSDKFDIDFLESLSIEILSHNRYVNVILFENDENVSSLNINLFDIKKNMNESSFINHKFIYNKTIEPSNKKIGSGHDIKEICFKNKARLKSSNLFKGKLWTTGEVNVKFGWNEKLNDNTRESVKSCIETGHKIKQLLQNKKKPNIDLLTEIINNLYECNIVDDKNIMNGLKDICNRSVKVHNMFDFEESSQEDIRFKLLHLRNNGGFVGLKHKSIPLFTSQISMEQLACLQKSEEKDYRDVKQSTEMDPIDLQRYIGMKFVEKLNKNLMASLNEFLLKKTYKDVVRDFGDLSIRSIFLNEVDLSLAGLSNITKQKLLKESLINEQELQIHVHRAFNLTDRSATLLTEDANDDDEIAGFRVRPLRPFVSISCHGVSARTATAIGCHPSWNYTVKLKTRLEPQSFIYVNIYDECKENAAEMVSDDQSTQSTVYYRRTNKWLGAIQIPLHTVLSFGSIRGTFKINTPPLIFGYESIPSKDQQSFIPEIMQFMKKETSLLVLQITSSLSHLGGYQMYCQPVPTQGQDDYIIQQLNKFVTDYVNDFPNRNISLTLIDSCGKNKCVSEFLQPIPLPDYDLPLDPKKAESAVSKSSGHSKSSSSKSSNFEVWKSEENELTRNIDAVVRYVSLVPTFDITESHVVTLMGVELLKVLYGSPLDHTILLASYFMELGIKCWVIMGFGLPRGESSYVLVKYFKNKVLTINDQIKNGKLFNKINSSFTWYVFDAVSGERFELREIGCPLKTVTYVFDSENIWVNTQDSQSCENVSFDFSNSSHWQAVFTKPLFPTRPILTESLYSKPGDVEHLRLNLETKIKSKVQKWRSHIKTIWNRYCSSLLKEMLPHYEYWAFNPMEPRPSLGNRMKQLMATYKIFGFPLNMPYINTKLIISNIKSTSIHMNDDPNVEFGLGVEVYAYPNNVISVWVFLACITRM
ncbi:unnamed protein product [Euphydryas editha]|uniref:C2 domain-containing protein n=1 Tax=Euphydryas editha TaxID=104508 RepID=A0AAU9TUK5_EUPED|nr:unnamed protein product [Euphydryas editha]